MRTRNRESAAVLAHQCLPDIPRGQQHIEHAVERRARGLRHGDDQDIYRVFA